MANIMDYLDWRGDLPLTVSPFNEVDGLILAELSFINFEGIVPPPELGRGVPQRQHGDIQLQNLRVEHARRALRFAAEHEPARRDFRNLRRRRRAADDFAENPLAAKPFRRLDGKLIRVIENEDHVVHASFPPTGRALICPIPKEAAPRLGETASSVTKGIRSARE